MYTGKITYNKLYQDLCSRAAAELSMAVQAVFQGEVHPVQTLRYAWSEDGTLLLTLDCCGNSPASAMSFAQLLSEVKNLCTWEFPQRVVIGFRHALVELLTIYHEFDLATDPNHTLMLVCTPPDEYFEQSAA